MASATNNKNTKLLPCMIVLISINLAANTLLSGFGIFDPHDLLILSHINIGAAMIMVVFLMTRAIRLKTLNKFFVKMTLIGMTAALLGVSIDMIRFWLDKNGSYGSSPFTQIGVLVFIVLEGAYLIKELMEKMAYTDGLTELANRAAFHEKEDQLHKAKKRCIIVQLDINYLKTVNDVHGHSEGDKHIMAAAVCIRDSFSDKGTCYRTGGDEFIVVSENTEVSDIEKILENMEQKVKEYNEKEKPPVPLALAYGYAEYIPDRDSLESVEKLADQRMYERKRMMKQK